MTQLGDLLTRNEETTSLSPDAEYREVTVKLWGRGVIQRGVVTGTAIAGQRRFIVRQGQFILSRIDARNGALGLIPSELDGAVVSNDFPVFNIERKRLLAEYLGWICRTASFVEECRRASEGTTNRVRLQENKFLAREIPLPPLPEQQRIVARIEALATEVNEARVLRARAAEEAEHLLIGMAHRLDLDDSEKQAASWRRMQLGEGLRFVDDSVRVVADQSYPNLGIYSFGRGPFRKSPIDGAATSAKTLRRVRAGQFIYSRLFAFEGAYGLVDEALDGHYVSNEYPTFDCDASLLRVEFLGAYFKAPPAWRSVAMGSKGLGHRRQRVQPDQLLGHVMWIPPVSWQEQIAKVWHTTAVVKNIQNETVAELDALLPAILDRAFKGEL